MGGHDHRGITVVNQWLLVLLQIRCVSVRGHNHAALHSVLVDMLPVASFVYCCTSSSSQLRCANPYSNDVWYENYRSENFMSWPVRSLHGEPSPSGNEKSNGSRNVYYAGKDDPS